MSTRSVCAASNDRPHRASEIFHDDDTAKHHERTRRDVLICRSTGEFAPRASVAIVTLGHLARKGSKKARCHETPGLFSLAYAKARVGSCWRYSTWLKTRRRGFE